MCYEACLQALENSSTNPDEIDGIIVQDDKEYPPNPDKNPKHSFEIVFNLFSQACPSS